MKNQVVSLAARTIGHVVSKCLPISSKQEHPQTCTGGVKEFPGYRPLRPAFVTPIGGIIIFGIAGVAAIIERTGDVPTKRSWPGRDALAAEPAQRHLQSTIISSARKSCASFVKDHREPSARGESIAAPSSRWSQGCARAGLRSEGTRSVAGGPGTLLQDAFRSGALAA